MKKKYERPVIRRMNPGAMNKFATGNPFTPVTDIDGVPVRRLMDDYGSPVFVLSEKQIRRNMAAAVRAFSTRYPAVQFAWSYKTNYLGAVCRIFHQEGSWAEVVSGFEYRRALQNGVPGRKIIFNGPDKKREDLELAVSQGSLVHIDHLDELYALIELAQGLSVKPRVAIRVNMDTGILPRWDRFGFNYENGQAWTALTKCVNAGFSVEGLHCHIGTFIQTTSAYAKAASALCGLALQCRSRLGIPVQYLDLGGGFPSSNTLKGAYLPGADTLPTLDEFAEAITSQVLSAGFRSDELPTLILESGRALIDDAGYLLGQVVANKRLSDGRRATIVDFGVNSLFTSFWYDHRISPASECSRETEETTIYGPLCMNIDVIRESIPLPLLNPGDGLVVHKVGAYNMTQWMQFIQLRPAVVLIDTGGNPHLIRKAETAEYLQEPELVPDHLKEDQNILH